MKSLARAKQFLLEKLSADPSVPLEGRIYYNSTTKVPMCYNGTSFTAMSGSSGMTDDEIGMMNSMGGMY